jgi:hypothetical protein
LTESDLEPMRGGVLVRRGKAGKRREVGMDQWGWDQLQPWLEIRAALTVGALFFASSMGGPQGAGGRRLLFAHS